MKKPKVKFKKKTIQFGGETITAYVVNSAPSSDELMRISKNINKKTLKNS